jgi:hypothetical protein
MVMADIEHLRRFVQDMTRAVEKFGQDEAARVRARDRGDQFLRLGLFQQRDSRPVGPLSRDARGLNAGTGDIIPPFADC